MKKIISLLMALTLIIATLAGMTAFADTDFGTPTLTAVYDSYDAGKGYHYVIIKLDGFKNFEEAWEDDDFNMNVKGISAYDFSVTTDNADAPVVNVAKASDGILGFTRNGAKNGGGYLYSSLEDYCTTTSGNIAKVYVRAAEDAKFTLSFGFSSVSVNDVVSGAATQVDFTTSNSKLKTVPLTVGGTSTPDDVVLNEETFEEGAKAIEEGATIKYGDKEVVAGANAKIYTFFSKAAKELLPETYGVTATIGGKAYKFPGAATVSAGQNWAIQFIVPNGEFSDKVAIENITAVPYAD